MVAVFIKTMLQGSSDPYPLSTVISLRNESTSMTRKRVCQMSIRSYITIFTLVPQMNIFHHFYCVHAKTAKLVSRAIVSLSLSLSRGAFKLRWLPLADAEDVTSAIRCHTQCTHNPTCNCENGSDKEVGRHWKFKSFGFPIEYLTIF